ncbi:MAG TPA: hypothetical protein PKO22_11575, partial [Treponemataceae bacterium]|nr:hypothetical protein [Treponemataceae bacterium]
INTEADLSRVVSGFMLLYPLGQNSDFISGLHYTWQYVSSLDQLRNKIIIVISDGIFNPPASSPYAAMDNGQVKTEISTISRKIRGAGWNVFYIKLPFPENVRIVSLDNVELQKDSGSKDSNAKNSDAKPTDGAVKQYYDVSGSFADDIGITTSTLPSSDVPINFVDSVFLMPEVEFPGNLGKQARILDLPLKITNTSGEAVNMELSGVYADDVNILGKPSFLTLSPKGRGTMHAELHIPPTMPKGPQSVPIRLEFSDNLRVIPQTGTLNFTLTGFSVSMLLRSGVGFALTIAFILAVILLVVFLLMFIVKKTTHPASEAIRSASEAETNAVSAKRVMEPAAIMATTPVAASLTVKGKGRTSSAQPAATATAMESAPASGEKYDTYESAVAKESASAISAFASANSVASGKPAYTYQDEKREYPKELDSTDATKLASVNALASSIAEENRERLSVLNTAVQKPAQVAKFTGASASEAIAVRKNGNIMLELLVDRQNPYIGKRNVHMMKAGSRLSIGGGQSAFLVFLVKFPANIAEIRYDGETCSLAILKPEYFPDENQNVIPDCLGKKFKIVSDKAYEITFGFGVFEDPVARLNKMLTSITY